MDDQRAFAIEESLWTGDPAGYPDLIDPACLMVIPAPPHILPAAEALRSLTKGARWSRVTLHDPHIARPEEGLIVLAYRATANKDDGTNYVADCTSTWRRQGHENWKLVQHQQTPQA
jgi:hypothetical protein